MSWLRDRWRKGQAQAPPPGWQRTARGGAIPITRAEERRRKLGTAGMAVNRWSVKLERAMVAGFLAFLWMLVVVTIATLSGSVLWHLYEGRSTGQVVLQSALVILGVVIWLNLTHQHYHRATRSAIADERNRQLGTDRQEPRGRGAGLDRPHPVGQTPTVPIKPAEDITTDLSSERWAPARPADTSWPHTDPRSNFEREFDQHKGIRDVDE